MVIDYLRHEIDMEPGEIRFYQDICYKLAWEDKLNRSAKGACEMMDMFGEMESAIFELVDNGEVSVVLACDTIGFDFFIRTIRS
jgi:uncharacterized protein (AIM24 family)